MLVFFCYSFVCFLFILLVFYFVSFLLLVFYSLSFIYHHLYFFYLTSFIFLFNYSPSFSILSLVFYSAIVFYSLKFIYHCLCHYYPSCIFLFNYTQWLYFVLLFVIIHSLFHLFTIKWTFFTRHLSFFNPCSYFLSFLVIFLFSPTSFSEFFFSSLPYSSLSIPPHHPLSSSALFYSSAIIQSFIHLFCLLSIRYHSVVVFPINTTTSCSLAIPSSLPLSLPVLFHSPAIIQSLSLIQPLIQISLSVSLLLHHFVIFYPPFATLHTVFLPIIRYHCQFYFIFSHYYSFVYSRLFHPNVTQFSTAVLPEAQRFEVFTEGCSPVCACVPFRGSLTNTLIMDKIHLARSIAAKSSQLCSGYVGPLSLLPPSRRELGLNSDPLSSTDLTEPGENPDTD